MRRIKLKLKHWCGSRIDLASNAALQAILGFDAYFKFGNAT